MSKPNKERTQEYLPSQNVLRFIFDGISSAMKHPIRSLPIHEQIEPETQTVITMLELPDSKASTVLKDRNSTAKATALDRIAHKISLSIYDLKRSDDPEKTIMIVDCEYKNLDTEMSYSRSYELTEQRHNGQLSLETPPPLLTDWDTIGTPIGPEACLREGEELSDEEAVAEILVADCFKHSSLADIEVLRRVLGKIA